jgi:hypothetical protein
MCFTGLWVNQIQTQLWDVRRRLEQAIAETRQQISKTLASGASQVLPCFRARVCGQNPVKNY